MMLSDVLHDPAVSADLRQALYEMALFEYQGMDLPLLTPTPTNDDVNGSQDAAGGGTDFTYRDADESDLDDVTALGFYEYFSRSGSQYTGHAYNGDGNHFAAIVLNPPAYAATRHL